jgi:hypothetical protein
MNYRFLAVSALLVAVCVAAVGAQVVAAGAQHAQHNIAAQAKPATVVPHKPAPAGPLPPLPQVSFTPSAPMPIVQQVYEFAARHPEVLQYMPCYCGCERAGHGGNHDCFVKSRAANGRIAQWDEHGIGCAVCLNVGYRAMTLFNQKKSVAEIRATIDKEIGSRYPSSTPTPRPRS